MAFPQQNKRPRIDVPHVALSNGADWQVLESVFAKTPAVVLQQSWLPTPEPGFEPAVVHVGRDARVLWVLAHLTDQCIFNAVQEFNAPFFLSGDVFEIFLRPLAQDTYYELHVGPENQQFQLRIPSGELFRITPREVSRTWTVETPLFSSWTRVAPEENLWQVLARIPFENLLETGAASPEWLFSFSRYDYTRGSERPVISSSSPHQEPGFHRQEEWGILSFT